MKAERIIIIFNFWSKVLHQTGEVGKGISEVVQIIYNMVILFWNTAEKIQFSITYTNI